MSQWQDISTAPKDGSDILLADATISGGFQTVASFEIGEALEMAWCTNDGVSYHAKAFTHWMPLPSPPEPTPPTKTEGRE